MTTRYKLRLRMPKNNINKKDEIKKQHSVILNYRLVRLTQMIQQIYGQIK